jgi:hypothetical protein
MTCASTDSAAEVFDVRGSFMEVTVCAVPWGMLEIRREVSHLEAVVSLLSAE